MLGALNPGTRTAFTRPAPADAIRDALAAALRERGHTVHAHVGRSLFRCDLAIVDPAGDGYGVAVLLDAPDAAVADTFERYVFRPGILRGFGWRVIDVPGRHWLLDRDAVLARIEAALAGRDTGDETAFASAAAQHVAAVAAPPSVPPQSSAPSAATADASRPGSVERRLRFEQGTSRKFWRATLAGSELTVLFGRIGSNGQSSLKTFDTPERAARELEKLVAEKLRRGYREA